MVSASSLPPTRYNLAKPPPSIKVEMPMTTTKPRAYSRPNIAISRLRSLLARNAMAKMVGMGNLPKSTSRLAAIKPKVAAGNRASAITLPTIGSSADSDMMAMKRKNNPLMAIGCFQNTRIPWRTHLEPVRALTTLSFIWTTQSDRPIFDATRVQNVLGHVA